MGWAFPPHYPGKTGALRPAPEVRNHNRDRGWNAIMNILLRLSTASSGRLLLHFVCLGRCFALRKPAWRARASFHWLGAKRELRLTGRARFGSVSRL